MPAARPAARRAVVPGWLRAAVSTGEQRHGASYRPGLDGCRGLFVLLVMMYHFGVTWLAGGWVGINTFFVLTGFLLGGILITQRQRRGAVDAAGFYLRRARRILPALTIVVAAIMVRTLVVEEGDRPQIAGDSFAAMTFWLNWRLVARDDQYVNFFADPSPLRHLWTLGVEEQVYLLLPLLITGLMLLRGRRARTALLVAAALGSALWAAWLARDGATGSRLYYGTDVRAQAFLVGLAAAALFTRGDRRDQPPQLGRRTMDLLGWLGVGGVAASIVLVGEADRWVYESGGILAFSVLAGGMCLAAGDTRSLTIHRVIGAAPFVHLGRISYGLYLYHWPIAMWLPLDGLPLPVSILVQLAVTWAVALLSYRYVELPILQRGFGALLPGLPGRRLVPATVAAAVAAVSLGFATVWSPAIDGDWDGRPLPGAQTYSPPDDELRVAVVGSSVAQSLRDGFDDDYPGLVVDGYTQRGSCNPVPLTFVFQGGGRIPEGDSCAAWRERWPEEVSRSGTDVVLSPVESALTEPLVVDGRTLTPGTPGHDRQIRRAMDALLEQTEASGARQLQVVNAVCKDEPAGVRDGAEVDAIRIDPEPTNRVLRDWATEVNAGSGPVTVAVLDLDAALCSEGYRATINGAEIYSDRLHYSNEGARLVWTWLAPQVVAAWQFAQT